MNIIPEPANAMAQCHQVWSNRLHHTNLVYITIYSLQGACQPHHKRQNHNLKVIIKSVTLYIIWLDHVTPLILFGHAPPVHASINPYHILPVLIRSIQGSHPSSLPWNSHETTFYTASTFKAILALRVESGFLPSPQTIYVCPQAVEES